MLVMYLCTQEKKCEQEVGLGYCLKAITQKNLNPFPKLPQSYQTVHQPSIQAQAYRDTSHSNCSTELKVK